MLLNTMGYPNYNYTWGLLYPGPAKINIAAQNTDPKTAELHTHLQGTIIKGFLEKKSGLAVNKCTHGKNSDGRSIVEKFFGKNSDFLKLTYLGQF